MKFSILSSLALSFHAVNVLAEDIQLWVNSNDVSINGNGISSLHEGAGINYFFLGTPDNSMTLSYDSASKMISSEQIGFLQQFAVSGYGGFAQLTVAGSSDQFTFNQAGTLLVNGTSQGLFACKNTGDPYTYSQSQYELMWYGAGSAPAGCSALSLSKNKPSSSSASTSTVPPLTVSSTVSSFSTVTLTTCTSCSGAKNTSSAHPSTTVAVISSANGAADLAVAPAGLAAAFGLAAYLL